MSKTSNKQKVEQLQDWLSTRKTWKRTFKKTVQITVYSNSSNG